MPYPFPSADEQDRALAGVVSGNCARGLIVLVYSANKFPLSVPGSGGERDRRPARVLRALALFVTTGGQAHRADLGLVLGCREYPLVVLLLFGGVWADRVARHRIMIVAADLSRAVLHGGLAALIFVGEVKIWQVVVIEACFGAAQAFFQPAYTGLLPQTVPEPLIQEARALTEATANLATLLGPALATLLVLGIGAGEAFAVDAATFVFSAALLTRVNPPPSGDGRGVRPDGGRPSCRMARGGLPALVVGHNHGDRGRGPVC